MKRALSLFVLLALLLPLAGCAREEEFTPPDTSGDPWGFALTVSEAWPTGCTLVYTQSGGEEITGGLSYGCEYRVEREEDGVWTRVPQITDHWAWFLIGYQVAMDSSEIETMNWSSLYGALPAGHYRVVKNIMDFRGTADYDTRDYYAEFDVK